MAEFVNITSQDISVGSNVLFNETVVNPCNLVTHRKGSGLFTFRGGHKFLLMFSANVTGTAAGAVSLAFSINGETVPYSIMTSVLAAAGDNANVSTFVEIVTPACCCTNVAISNVGTTEITVNGANLVIFRED